MRKIALDCAIVLLVFLAAATIAAADPIKLKLAFFSSDRSAAYQAAIAPFVDAVNSDARGLLHIEVYPSGALGKNIALQPRLVLDGGADIAFIVPGYTPQLFPDNAVLELPGLFRDGSEATHVFTRLIAERAMAGYRDYFVIGAFASEPESIHGRVEIASVDDLNGRRIRVNNANEGFALKIFGAVPVQIQVTDIAAALSSGMIDAATIARAPLVDFGISRVATHHFFMRTGVASLALVMNRKVFDGLPADAQAIIQKYSGTWMADRFSAAYERLDNKVMEQLRADPKRQVVIPSAADLTRIDAVFKVVRGELVAGNPHYQSLLRAVENELGNLRQE